MSFEYPSLGHCELKKRSHGAFFDSPGEVNSAVDDMRLSFCVISIRAVKGLVWNGDDIRPLTVWVIAYLDLGLPF